MAEHLAHPEDFKCVECGEDTQELYLAPQCHVGASTRVWILPDRLTLRVDCAQCGKEAGSFVLATKEQT